MKIKMKKIYAFVLMMIMICAFQITAFANFEDNGYTRVEDFADEMSDSEERDLRSELDSISAEYNVDVVYIIVDSLEGYSAEDYADNAFDYWGYGQGSNRDGVLLLVCPSTRDWHISTRGFGITAFTDYAIEYVGEQIKPDLKAGDYAGAGKEFGEWADKIIGDARDGKKFKKPYNLGKSILVSVVLGLIVGGVYLASLFGQLKSVAKQDKADFYTRQGSMQVTDRREFFLYHKVDRTRKQQSSGGSSTHTSSSGATHGGGGGKF